MSEMSKTYQYRKVMKPMLERKRRARMNLYLDELKDLIVDGMEAEGEHINKLEKADILELTVNYLKTHKNDFGSQTQASPQPAAINVEKFKAGYTQAAYEVSKVFASLPEVDLHFGTRLMKHLGYQLKDLDKQPSATVEKVDFVKPQAAVTAPKRKRLQEASKQCPKQQ